MRSVATHLFLSHAKYGGFDLRDYRCYRPTADKTLTDSFGLALIVSIESRNEREEARMSRHCLPVDGSPPFATVRCCWQKLRLHANTNSYGDGETQIDYPIE